jgi:hypothetical protein
MKLFWKVEGIMVNHFPLWLNFKIHMEIELKILEPKFEFLEASNHLGKIPKILS